MIFFNIPYQNFVYLPLPPMILKRQIILTLLIYISNFPKRGTSIKQCWNDCWSRQSVQPFRPHVLEHRVLQLGHLRRRWARWCRVHHLEDCCLHRVYICYVVSHRQQLPRPPSLAAVYITIFLKNLSYLIIFTILVC